jgi:polyphenol oxidase
MLYTTHKDFQPENIKYGFFNKIAGFVSRKKYPEATNDESKSIISNVFGCDKLYLLDQQHTNKVELVEGQNNLNVADAMVTKKRNVALAILTADCVPVLFSDEKKQIIGAAHAGWRGARHNILSETVKSMKDLGANNITALIGPCIKQNNYEVDQSFYEDFISEDTDFGQFFIPSERATHYKFDLTGYVIHKLKLAQVDKIFDIERDTYSDEENYFSFRRHTHFPEKEIGNCASVIMLK